MRSRSPACLLPLLHALNLHPREAPRRERRSRAELHVVSPELRFLLAKIAAELNIRIVAGAVRLAHDATPRNRSRAWRRASRSLSRFRTQLSHAGSECVHQRFRQPAGRPRFVFIFSTPRQLDMRVRPRNCNHALGLYLPRISLYPRFRGVLGKLDRRPWNDFRYTQYLRYWTAPKKILIDLR